MANISTNHIGRQREYSRWFGLLALIFLLVIYGWTLQKDVNGSSHDYLLDTGEIQVALNLWGTIHYTGYPHYTILSALLTHLLRGLSLSPAAAASATSLIWSLLGLFLFYKLVSDLVPSNQFLPALAIIAAGLIETLWMHSIITEVYSFGLCLIILTIFMCVKLRQKWQPSLWLLTVFVLGTAVAHHRLFVLILPTIAILVWQEGWLWFKQRPLHVLYSGLAFLLPFLVYIYLPLRAWQGAAWVYGQPGTWSGFWQQFTGSEVTGGLLRLPQNGQGWVDNFKFISSSLAEQLPWLVIFIGLAGLLWLTRRNPREGVSLLYGTLIYPLFAFLFPKAVWVSAVFMPTVLFLMLGVTYLLSQITRSWPKFQPVIGMSLLLLAALLLFKNLPLVQQLTHDPTGRDIITLLQAMPHEPTFPGTEPLVALPWGTTFFAANYGLRVTHELSELKLVDHRANFRTLINEKGSVITPGGYLDYWSPAWWQELLGPVQYNAVTPGLVAISKQAPYQDVPAIVDFALGNGIRIRSLHYMLTDKLKLLIYWEAMEPITQNYSVAVHLVTRFPPEGPQDIVAQADAAHPVQGWYPTTQWAAGEVVCDQYELVIPSGSEPTAVAITMYRVNEAGQFENGNWFVLPLLDEK